MKKTTKLPNGGELYEYSNGFKSWCLNHQYHREDGHAVEWPNGKKEWWLNDKLIPCSTQKEFERLMKLKAFW